MRKEEVARQEGEAVRGGTKERSEDGSQGEVERSKARRSFFWLEPFRLKRSQYGVGVGRKGSERKERSEGGSNSGEEGRSATSLEGRRGRRATSLPEWSLWGIGKCTPQSPKKEAKRLPNLCLEASGRPLASLGTLGGAQADF